jgi:hypothetical protein
VIRLALAPKKSEFVAKLLSVTLLTLRVFFDAVMWPLSIDFAELSFSSAMDSGIGTGTPPLSPALAVCHSVLAASSRVQAAIVGENFNLYYQFCGGCM